MNGGMLTGTMGLLRRATAAVKSVSIRVVAGFAILTIAALLYLGPYSADAASCLDEIVRARSAERSIDWQCFRDVLDVFRKDGTAATVILAIAAAILASAWSSGSRTEE